MNLKNEQKRGVSVWHGFFILRGASIVFKGTQHDACEAINSETKAKSTAVGLTITSTVNEGQEHTAVIIGVEISPSRIFYQGQTERLLDSEPPEEIDHLFNDMMRDLHEKYGDLYNEEKGIFVSRFD
jgi:hypothetical protein